MNYRVEYSYGPAGSVPGYTIQKQEFPAYAQLGTWENSHYHSDILGIDFTIPASWNIQSEGQCLCQTLSPEQLPDATRKELTQSVYRSLHSATFSINSPCTELLRFVMNGVSVGSADTELVILQRDTLAQLILITEDLSGTGYETMADTEYTGLVQNILTDKGLTIQDTGTSTFRGAPCSFVAATGVASTATGDSFCSWIISQNHNEKMVSWVMIIPEDDNVDVEDTLEEIVTFLSEDP